MTAHRFDQVAVKPLPEVEWGEAPVGQVAEWLGQGARVVERGMTRRREGSIYIESEGRRDHITYSEGDWAC
jgi:hypothetical protein